MKQTAVEWLELNLLGLISFDSEELRVKYKERVAKAKEIEKQQIIEAGNTCVFKQTIHNRKVDLMSLEELKDLALKDAINVGEEYYNETFKNKKL
jgi:hypothetical protein